MILTWGEGIALAFETLFEQYLKNDAKLMLLFREVCKEEHLEQWRRAFYQMLEFYIQDKVCICLNNFLLLHFYVIFDNVKFMLGKFIMYIFFFLPAMWMWFIIIWYLCTD